MPTDREQTQPGTATQFGEHDLFKPCSFCGHDPKLIVLDPEVWTRIVMRGTDDPGLQALIDQAVMGPKR